MFGLHGIGQFPRLQRALVDNTCNVYPFMWPCELANFLVTGVAAGQVSAVRSPFVWFRGSLNNNQQKNPYAPTEHLQIHDILGNDTGRV